MQSYILSVLGIVLVSVLIEIILPSGQTAKYIKSVFSIFVVYVLISPILSMIKKDYDITKYLQQGNMQINQTLLNNIYKDQIDAKNTDIENILENAGYTTMLYASENYLNNTWLSLKDYTIWAAKYSSKMPSINAGNEYILWQNTDKGRVDGIEGNVDLDIYYK